MSRKTFNPSQNQLSLPFGEPRSGNNRTVSYEDRGKVFWFLISVLLLSFGLYIYAINATAHNIAVRQNLEREVAELSARLGTLEFASIELRNAITLEQALELGFSEIKHPLYVSRLRDTVARSNTAGNFTLNTLR